MMAHVELMCGATEDCLYVDLFVKETNTKAIGYYKKREKTVCNKFVCVCIDVRLKRDEYTGY